MANAETVVQNSVLLRLSALGAVVFRQNTGQLWAGRVVAQDHGRVVLDDARPVRAGLCTGSSDIIGWKPVTVTSDMVGSTIAVFVAAEVKVPKTGNKREGKATAEQSNFLAAVLRDGGIAGIVRSPEDAERLITQ